MTCGGDAVSLAVVNAHVVDTGAQAKARRSVRVDMDASSEVLDRYMNGLVELVFPEVPDLVVNDLIEALVTGQPISEAADIAMDRSARDYLQCLSSAPEPNAIFLKMPKMILGGLEIRNPILRALRHEASNEITLAFDSGDVIAQDRHEAVLALAAGAQALARIFSIENFFCGFEPATDENTQLFSARSIGPLKTI